MNSAFLIDVPITHLKEIDIAFLIGMWHNILSFRAWGMGHRAMVKKAGCTSRVRELLSIAILYSKFFKSIYFQRTSTQGTEA
jgi:hypothetical protein